MTPDRARFHVGDAVRKLMLEAKLKQNALAALSRHRRNTISDLINGAVESEPGTLSDVIRVLDTHLPYPVDHAYVYGMVRTMNGQLDSEPAALRAQNMREEDRDPVKNEAMQYAKRIARLPRLARIAIYNCIAAFEDAFGSDK
jgi:hypothetical protein